MVDKHRRSVCVSDLYAGQQELVSTHQVYLAHVLGMCSTPLTAVTLPFALRLRDLLRWTSALAEDYTK